MHSTITYSNVYPFNDDESELASICSSEYDNAPRLVPALNPMKTGVSVHSHATFTVCDVTKGDCDVTRIMTSARVLKHGDSIIIVSITRNYVCIGLMSTVSF